MSSEFEEFVQAMNIVRNASEEVMERFLEVALACGNVVEFIAEVEKERENKAICSYMVMHEF